MMLPQVATKIDVVNPVTGESLHRIQWSRNKSSITVYTNFGLWKVFTGREAQMVNAAFVRAMNEISNMTDEKAGKNGVD